MESRSNAGSRPGYRRTSILRTATPGRSKLYYEFNQGVVGTHSDIDRWQHFGLGAAGEPSFVNLVENGSFAAGLTGWVRTSTPDNASVSGGQLVLLRHASQEVRLNRPVNCVVGKRYLVGAKLAGGSIALDACKIVVGLHANGSLTGALVQQSYSAQGYLSVLFTATQASHYVAVVLTAGTAGQTAYVEDFTLIQLD